MASFIPERSIVRRIWGDADLVLLIFAGGAAEFALNKAVDWLFFTNRLPRDPIGGLFSTVQYAQEIVFASEKRADETLARINAVHAAVERARGSRIPEWAHRDVLYMLIDYSRRAYELMNRPLTRAEQRELYEGFLKVGRGLAISSLPETFDDWLADRQLHLTRDLVYSEYTKRLFERYRAQLGWWRYRLLIELQTVLVPERVRELLSLTPQVPLVGPAVSAYSLIARLGLQGPLQHVLIPRAYWHRIAGLTPHERRASNDHLSSISS